MYLYVLKASPSQRISQTFSRSQKSRSDTSPKFWWETTVGHCNKILFNPIHKLIEVSLKVVVLCLYHSHWKTISELNILYKLLSELVYTYSSCANIIFMTTSQFTLPAARFPLNVLRVSSSLLNLLLASDNIILTLAFKSVHSSD